MQFQEMINWQEKQTSKLQQRLQSLEAIIRNRGEGPRRDTLKDYRFDERDIFKNVHLSGQFQFPMSDTTRGNQPNGGVTDTISQLNQAGNNSQG